jgi:uncharacterized repeat protein (TIGR02543 family)
MSRGFLALFASACVATSLAGCTALLGDFNEGQGSIVDSGGPDVTVGKDSGPGSSDGGSEASVADSGTADADADVNVVPTYTVTVNIDGMGPVPGPDGGMPPAPPDGGVGGGTVTTTNTQAPPSVGDAGTDASVAGVIDGGASPITCSGDECSGAFVAGSLVSLTAMPAQGSIFTGWSGGGCSGTGSCVLTVSQATTLTASFGLAPYTLSVIPEGSGTGTVVADNDTIECGTTCTSIEPEGSTVTLSVTPSVGSTFAGWSGGGCSGSGSCAVAITGTETVMPVFALQQLLLSVTDKGLGSGTVTSADAKISCGTQCSANYGYGTNVTLTASPNSGSTFTGWSGGGCSGTGACVVSLTQATSVSATFALQTAGLTVSLSGNGSGTVGSSDTPQSINCGTTCSASYAYGTLVTLTATPASGSIFGGWSGAGCSGTGACVVTIQQAASVTATFTASQYSLTVIPNGTGTGTVTSSDTPQTINCGTTCAASYSANTTVTLTAAAAAGSTFTGWGGACSGTGTCTVSITGTKNVIANYALEQFALTVSSAGGGMGTVTSNDSPQTIDCGATCSAAYNYGASITLTATPAAGSTFTGWSGAGASACTGTGNCTVSVVGAQSVTANFVLEQLVLSVNNSGSGSVSSGDSTISCGNTCSASYNYGTVVTLTATAATGWTFNGWTGGGCAGTTSPTCQVTMDAAEAVTAIFAENRYNLTVATGGVGGATGTITSGDSEINCGSTCSATYLYGTTVTLTATPGSNSLFTGWGGACTNTTGTCVVTMSAAETVTAKFAPASYTLTLQYNGGCGHLWTSDGTLDCGATFTRCSASYPTGTQVTINGTNPESNDGWTGDCTGAAINSEPYWPTCVLTMNQAHTAGATFASAAWYPGFTSSVSGGPTYTNLLPSGTYYSTVAAGTATGTTQAEGFPLYPFGQIEYGTTTGDTFYWEISINSSSTSDNGGIGVADSTEKNNEYLGYPGGADVNDWASANPSGCASSGTCYGQGIGTGYGDGYFYSTMEYVTWPSGPLPSTWELATNNVYMFAYNGNTGYMWIGLNGAWAFGGNPATGTTPTLTGLEESAVDLYPAMTLYGNDGVKATFNCGTSAFHYTPPKGF